MIDKAEVRRTPLDVEALNKGDVIREEELAEITGKEVGSQEYSFAVLALGEMIMKGKEKMGDPVTVRICKGNMEILDDETASQYNDRRFVVNMGKMMKSHVRLMQVDDTKFDDETKKLHAKRMQVNGITLQAAMMGRAGKLELEPYERKTPLPAASERN